MKGKPNKDNKATQKGNKDNKAKQKDGEKGESKKGEKQSNGDDNNSGWTTDQDNQIKSMKADGKSWKDIAAAVGASKKDVQHRFKELNKKDEKVSESEGIDGGDEAGFGDLDGIFDESEAGGDSGNASENNKKKKHKKCIMEGCEECGKKTGSHGKNVGGKEQTDGGSGQVEGENNVDNWREPEQQNSTGQDTNGNSQTNNNQSGNGRLARLKPDDVWSLEDLEVLEWLESKYNENKWVHLQASFYNWTGRMIDGVWIEKKFKEDGAV